MTQQSTSPLRPFVRLILVFGLIGCATSLTIAQTSKFIEYQCSVCSKTISHQRGALPPKTCPHCGAKFDGMTTQNGNTVSFGSQPSTQPVSNFAILGILCGLFSLTILGGGIALVVYLVKQSKTNSKRRVIRRRDDEYDDEDEDEEDDRRPDRRRR